MYRAYRGINCVVHNYITELVQLRKIYNDHLEQ